VIQPEKKLAPKPPPVKIYVDSVKKASVNGPDDADSTEALRRALIKRGLLVLPSSGPAASGVEPTLDKAAYRLTRVIRIKAKFIPPLLGELTTSSEMDIQAVLVTPQGTEIPISPIESKTEFTSAEFTGNDVTMAAAHRAIAALVGLLADAVVKLAVPSAAK
jgi:hypothetical protein